jgi:hypothetical protein
VNLTLIFIGITAFAWIIFDVYIIKKKGFPESISAHVIKLSRRWQLFTFLAGMLAGHFFWPMSNDKIYKNTECKKVESELPRQD